ncbi:MAG: TetR/AcrR family transcriptional regulator [Leifsonia sp.]
MSAVQRRTPPDPAIAAVRGERRASGDPRVQRTRQKLFDAVERLSAGPGEVTVSTILAESGVSRATFYTHFADLDELAFRMQESAFDAIAAAARAELSGDPVAAMLAAQRRLVAHYDGHRSLYAAVFRLPAGRIVQARVVALMTDAIREHIRDTRSLPAGLDIDLTSNYIAGAATGLLVSWVLDDVQADPEQLAQHLLKLMPAWMHSGHGAAGTTGDGQPERNTP